MINKLFQMVIGSIVALAFTFSAIVPASAAVMQTKDSSKVDCTQVETVAENSVPVDEAVAGDEEVVAQEDETVTSDEEAVDEEKESKKNAEIKVYTKLLHTYDKLLNTFDKMVDNYDNLLGMFGTLTSN